MRRLGIEPLEDRRLLSVAGQDQAIELFSTSPALFVENQGQWEHESLRFLHQGDGVKLTTTDTGPASEDFLPLTATVTVLDESALPMSDMEVWTVNHEYGFRQSVRVDAGGIATLEVMPGTWSFYAYPTSDRLWFEPGKGYLLTALGESFVASSRSLTLMPDETVAVNLSSSVFDFTARENYVEMLVEPYGQYLTARRVGVVVTDTMTLHTNTGLEARARVTSPRSSGEVLVFVQDAIPLSSPYTIEVTSDNSSVLEFRAADAAGLPTSYHVQLHTYSFSWAWSPAIYDLRAEVSAVRVSAHEFYLLRRVDMFDNSAIRFRAILNTVVVQPEGGQTLLTEMGGPLTAAAVRATPRAASHFAPACQIMLSLHDAYGNFVTDIWDWRTGSRRRPTVVVHHGGQTSDPFEAYSAFVAKLRQQFDRQENPTYEITWDFGPWGSGVRTGELYGQEERRMAIDETELLLSQAPRIDPAYRLPQVESYQTFAEAMEVRIGVPVDYKMGVISNIAHAGFEDEVNHGYKLEMGIELTRPTAWPPGVGYVDHEAGHGRIRKPPARFGAVGRLGEAYATLIGVASRSDLYGGPEYLKYLLGNHDVFLRYQHGAPLPPDDGIEMMQFITHYINTHYGWTPHRRMILEWNNAFLEIRSHLGGLGYSDIEQYAVVYSWLCGDNLGPLFEAAAFPVTESRVAEAVDAVNTYLGATGGLHLRLGPNTVEAPQTSVPIELVSPPAIGVSDIQLTVGYDPAMAAVTGVHRRDLTGSPDWTLSWDASTPGEVVIELAGGSEVAGMGSVAQINFELLPDASGALDVDFLRAVADGTPVSAIGGSLPLSPTPLIGPFPNLPDAAVAHAYSTHLWATAGTAPYAWTVVEDDLPPGLTLDPATGEIHGQPLTAGEYLFRVNATDQNTYVTSRWFTIVVTEPQPSIVGRHVFYNNSIWDGENPDPNPADDNSIPSDKEALLPGTPTNTATFASYTSYSRGINGIMVDMAGLAGTPVVNDFEFKVGNDNDPGGWGDGPEPTSVTVRLGAGDGGSDRVTLIWEDHDPNHPETTAVAKQWLQVTVLATENTGLAGPDVFYFGNAVGESGNSTSDAKVNAVDMLVARDNQRGLLDPAPIDFNCDFDRNARVNAADMLIARNNTTHFLNALKLISVPAKGDAGTAMGKGTVPFSLRENRDSPPAVMIDWLCQYDDADAAEDDDPDTGDYFGAGLDPIAWATSAAGRARL